MKTCEICGVTEEETRIIVSRKHKMTLCRRHSLQKDRHGKILKRTIYEPNEIRIDGDYAFIGLYNKKGEHIWNAKIDVNMVELCKSKKWYRRTHNYVCCSLKGKKKPIHRFIWEHTHTEEIPKWYVIDHIDGDPSNNTLENLRVVTQQENTQNMHKEGKTVGVGYHKWNGVYKWVPSIMVDGKGIWLGVYDDEQKAIAVRKAAELKYFSINHK